jgi:hypothetical protein
MSEVHGAEKPAHAGAILDMRLVGVGADAVPRTCGGDPSRARRDCQVSSCSLPTRG